MRWPDYGGFLADRYLWASPREFPHDGVAKTVLEMPQNRGRDRKKEGDFQPFLEGLADLGVNFGRPNCV